MLETIQLEAEVVKLRMAGVQALLCLARDLRANGNVDVGAELIKLSSSDQIEVARIARCAATAFARDTPTGS